MPRLPLWRQTYPEIALEVIGTDTVIDLAAGNADVAIRYAFASPAGLAPSELLRDPFWKTAAWRQSDPSPLWCSSQLERGCP